jgi:hypothetical protein
MRNKIEDPNQADLLKDFQAAGERPKKQKPREASEPHDPIEEIAEEKAEQAEADAILKKEEDRQTLTEAEKAAPSVSPESKTERSGTMNEAERAYWIKVYPELADPETQARADKWIAKIEEAIDDPSKRPPRGKSLEDFIKRGKRIENWPDNRVKQYKD